jgi:hypothetical protein
MYVYKNEHHEDNKLTENKTIAILALVCNKHILPVSNSIWDGLHLHMEYCIAWWLVIRYEFNNKEKYTLYQAIFPLMALLHLCIVFCLSMNLSSI